MEKLKLFASGDSFTDASFTSREYGTTISKAWPEVLAERLGDNWEAFNAGCAGHGNDYIVSSLFRYIALNGKPDCVAICWTSSGRLTLTGNNRCKESRPGVLGRIHIDPVGWLRSIEYKPWKQLSHDDHMIKAFTDFSEYFTRKHFPHNYYGFAVENFLTNVFTVQDYCTSNNIPYVFISGINICGSYDELAERSGGRSARFSKCVPSMFINSNMFNAIDDETFIGWPLFSQFGGFIFHDIIKHKNHRREKYCMGEKDGHPNDAGHALMADMMYKRLKEVKL